MSELPIGWASVSFDSLCALNPKHSKEIEDDTEVSFIPMTAVSDKLGIITSHETIALGKVRNGYTHFRDSDILFAKITPCMQNGKAAVVSNLKNGLGCGSTEFFVFLSRGAVIPKLFHRFIRQIRFRKEAEQQMTGAVGQARVPKDYLLTHGFPLPPLPEFVLTCEFF